jgi:hypothetical protein
VKTAVGRSSSNRLWRSFVCWSAILRYTTS